MNYLMIQNVVHSLILWFDINKGRGLLENQYVLLEIETMSEVLFL
jgi:hypothetical protein